MRIKLKLLPVFLFLVLNLCYQVYCSEDTPLFWQTAVEKTISNNLSLQISSNKIKEAALSKEVNQSALLPRLDSSVELSQTNTDHTATTALGYNLNGEAVLLDNGNRQRAVDSAQINLESAEIQLGQDQTQYIFQLRRIFLELLRSQQLLLLSDQIIERRQQQLDIVNLRYKAGLEHIGSLLTTQVNLKRAIKDKSDIQSSILLNRKQLCAVMNIPFDTSIVVSENLQSQKEVLTPDFESMINQHPQLQNAALQMEIARLNLENTLAASGITVKGLVNGNLGETYYLDADSRQNNSWSASLALSYPLFDGNSNASQLKISYSRFEDARLTLLNQRNSLAVDITSAWGQYDSAQGDIILAEQDLDAVTQRARITQTQYSSGLVRFDTWLSIENELVNALKSDLNTRINALQKKAAFIQTKGGNYNEFQ